MAVHQRAAIGRSNPSFVTLQQHNALRPIRCAARGVRTIIGRYVREKAKELANMRRHHVRRPRCTEQGGGVAFKGGQCISIKYSWDIEAQDIEDSLPNRCPCPRTNGKGGNAIIDTGK